MGKGLPRCTLPLAVLMLASPMKAEETNTCVPNCRSGYLCHEGTCVSRCNPPCEKGSICSQTGECQAITRNPSPDAPTGGLRFAVMGGILMPGEILRIHPMAISRQAGWILRGTADSFITRKLCRWLSELHLFRISYGSSLRPQHCRHRCDDETVFDQYPNVLKGRHRHWIPDD